MWRRLAYSVLALGLLGGGCEEDECDDAVCETDSLGINIDAQEIVDAPDQLRDGEYEIDVIADGVATSCQLSSPPRLEDECDAGHLLVIFQPLLAGFAIRVREATPRSVSFVVRYEGVVVAAETVEPTYDSYPAPNYEECGPICKSARLNAAPLNYD